jgi:hypothetical protein
MSERTTPTTRPRPAPPPAGNIVDRFFAELADVLGSEAAAAARRELASQAAAIATRAAAKAGLTPEDVRRLTAAARALRSK